MKLVRSDVVAMVAVKDLEKAKEFYGKTLGLNEAMENPGGVGYKSGTGMLFVYQSDNAGTNKATSASWNVEDIEDLAEELKAAGVSFEHYDIPGAQQAGDISVMGSMKAAWFKDPDGNILGLTQM